MRGRGSSRENQINKQLLLKYIQNTLIFIVFTAILCLFLQIAASQINVFNLIFAIILLFSKQVNTVIYKLFGLRHSLNELFYLPQKCQI